jgi:hypothetical protein
VPGILISRRYGKFRVKVQGCCGSLDGVAQEYEQALLDQILREGGRIQHREFDSVEVVDRRGRVHLLRGSLHDPGS